MASPSPSHVTTGKLLPWNGKKYVQFSQPFTEYLQLNLPNCPELETPWRFTYALRWGRGFSFFTTLLNVNHTLQPLSNFFSLMSSGAARIPQLEKDSLVFHKPQRQGTTSYWIFFTIADAGTVHTKSGKQTVDSSTRYKAHTRLSTISRGRRLKKPRENEKRKSDDQ